MEFSFTVVKDKVLEEVAKTTAYLGAKNDNKNDGKNYETIATVDADNDMLERFWKEACQDLTLILKRFIKQDCVMDYDSDYKVDVQMNPSFNDAFVPTIRDLMNSFAVETVTAKWLGLMKLSDEGGLSHLQVQHETNATNIKDKLREALRAQKGRIKRKMSVF